MPVGRDSPPSLPTFIWLCKLHKTRCKSAGSQRYRFTTP
uniref:Uncharacterized protein n=1 Tax=Siphoviridae sp. ctb8j11 TaxID=2825564 RepID=A0A8S5PIL3_9CAUD|nr:MAG TPA: hypothetical protein [Siphoviridae sp. ctb8j11]